MTRPQSGPHAADLVAASPIADRAAYTLEHRSELARDAEQNGLYSTSFEHDACGMGFVASIKGVKSHAIVKDALQCGEYGPPRRHRCDPCTGDGAGILVQVPTSSCAA